MSPSLTGRIWQSRIFLVRELKFPLPRDVNYYPRRADDRKKILRIYPGEALAPPTVLILGDFASFFCRTVLCDIKIRKKTKLCGSTLFGYQAVIKNFKKNGKNVWQVIFWQTIIKILFFSCIIQDDLKLYPVTELSIYNSWQLFSYNCNYLT